MIRKLAAIGDSFSTTTYGRSWPDHISDRLQSSLVRACSAGAGNAFYVEKCHDIVKVSNWRLCYTNPINLSRPTTNW